MATTIVVIIIMVLCVSNAYQPLSQLPNQDLSALFLPVDISEKR
jgi:hypothetical protein